MNSTTPGPPKTPSSAKVYPGPGFRIRLDYPRTPVELIQRFQAYDVPDISDTLNRLYALDSSITCQNAREQVLCGTVCTVRVFPGDNLMVHKVLDVARPGDIVVVDAHGDRSMNAILGDTICAKAKHRGIQGFVVDGLVRDMPGVDELDYPVYARGTTAVGPLHRGPGEINYPICCGGVVVNPGDILIARMSGIVVIPRDHAPLIIDRLDASREKMVTYLEKVKQGEFSNAWVDEVLEASNCLIDNGTEPNGTA